MMPSRRDATQKCAAIVCPRRTWNMGFPGAFRRGSHHDSAASKEVHGARRRRLRRLRQEQDFRPKSLIKAKEWMVDLVDTSLEAGKRDQGYPLQYVCTPMVQKGAPVDPVSRNNLGTFRSPARNPGMSSDTDFDMLVLKTKEWAVYLLDLRLEAWPDLSQGYEPFRRVNKDGIPVARVSQTIPYTLMGPVTISSVTNAEVPSFFQVLHPLKGPARNYGISPVTNAGGLPSQAMSAILAPPYDQLLISTEKDAGALSSKAMSAILASPSKYIKADADALPSETMSAIWASPYENSLVSTVTNAGTQKHLSQEHCYTENVCQDFSPRKNPRMELTTVGQGFNPKRQRTTPASLIEGEAEGHLTPCS